VGEVGFGEGDGENGFGGGADGAGVEEDLIAIYVECELSGSFA
jgi:hypothetical protein